MEYITANSTEYQCSNVTTGTNTISFTTEGDVVELKTAFEGVTELTVSGEDKVAYGEYANLSFQSATVFEDGAVMVTMHIPSDMELSVKELQATQEEQDEAIMELQFGGEA